MIYLSGVCKLLTCLDHDHEWNGMRHHPLKHETLVSYCCFFLKLVFNFFLLKLHCKGSKCTLAHVHRCVRWFIRPFHFKIAKSHWLCEWCWLKEGSTYEILMSSFMLGFLPIVTHTVLKRYWMIDPASVWLDEALFKMEPCLTMWWKLQLQLNFRHLEKPCQHKPPTSTRLGLMC